MKGSTTGRSATGSRRFVSRPVSPVLVATLAGTAMFVAASAGLSARQQTPASPAVAGQQLPKQVVDPYVYNGERYTMPIANYKDKTPRQVEAVAAAASRMNNGQLILVVTGDENFIKYSLLAMSAVRDTGRSKIGALSVMERSVVYSFSSRTSASQ